MDLRPRRSGQDPHRSHEEGSQLRLRRIRACNDNDLSRRQHHHRNLRCRKSPAHVARYCSGRCVELGLRRLRRSHCCIYPARQCHLRLRPRRPPQGDACGGPAEGRLHLR
ncbi:hypothetical protein VDG09_03180 [Xanthomonas campestris pv. raphani]|nr:hypothetical protein [Xanthomonas campestris]MEA9826667.1 hypothetical protein [Xanthomonas campestris pv. raphani]